ncbi:MAG: GH3 auxin-responsive promoter family protein [Prolixibacteraceae bacterium]|jgi:hypothetical protein
MRIKSVLSKPYSHLISNQLARDFKNPVACQQKIFRDILAKGKLTAYGKKFGFDEINSYTDFQVKVPVAGYEEFRPWIERISNGEKYVLWPGMPLYFAKTSGTTSGVKYIPVTQDSIHNHIDTARNALLNYIHVTGKSAFADHRMIFLQGSPILEKHGVVDSGRLSGIAAHYVPGYLQKNRLPSWETNCMEDWETKVDRIVEETIRQRMSLISGIPSWLRMYFEKLVAKGGKPVGELFPDFQLLVYGGVNYEPYRTIFDQLVGRPIDTMELFPASEGFFAFQDRFPADDLLLNINSGIFYEFIPLENYHQDNPERIPLEGVKCGIDYALIVTTNAGLYAYSVGDTVRFTSTNPYRIKVSGRISHFISAFGEHVIASEVESALAETIKICPCSVREFTVAPFIHPDSGKSRHEWLIEFDRDPGSMEQFSAVLNAEMCKKNMYYNDLIKGHVLNGLLITKLSQDAFNRYMKMRGMLGGQNKVPRLANDRAIADALTIQE